LWIDTVVPKNQSMQSDASAAPSLPPPIASYFANQTTDPDALAACFTDDAVVLDEGQEHRGRPAIAAWIRVARSQYSFATEVLGVDTDVAPTTVLTKVTGNFPGSPIALRYRFTVTGERIARLEVAP
jgi:ketosteroid isomerase-like protein